MCFIDFIILDIHALLLAVRHLSTSDIVVKGSIPSFMFKKSR